ncbi:diguanylate cyclase [Aquabacter sp. L1I39]|uniref:diguanylate cyclase domain-containing protein n=1 Tax=Aquabacter sp. L1I39 TaxID=2820278 RepID=UPI001ADCF031|nr:diguanylate cyclase [Aquabacter sp. L1I39]QTL03121.1 diguanylate cyclase [Aquabacter sp. L1I39]
MHRGGTTSGGANPEAGGDDLLHALCDTARLTLRAEMAGFVSAGTTMLAGGGGDALARLAPLLARLDGADGPLVLDAHPHASGLFAGFALAGKAGAPVGRFFITRPSGDALSATDRALFEGFARMAQAQARQAEALASATQQAALYRLLADTTTDTIVRGTLDGVRTYISPSVRTLLGYEPEEMIGRRAAEIVHPDDAAQFGLLMADMRAGRIGVAVSETRQRHRDGSWVWLEAFVKLTYDATGKADGYVASVRNISRRKEAELQLQHLASHDSLTGLANRAFLKSRLDACLAGARDGDAGLALLCLDLDNFKQVNDAGGHAAGDALLCAMAERCRSELGPGDLMARLGGDEFAILHPAPPGDAGLFPAASARRLGERLIAIVSRPFDLPGGPVQVGVSVGIALPPAATPDDLLRRADAALYAAKRQGRGLLVMEGPGNAATV